MKHNANLSIALVGLILMIGGCTTTGATSSSHALNAGPQVTFETAEPTFALATFEPAPSANRATAQTRGFNLGAGDALGQAIYANYAAIARANAGWQYASGTNVD